MVVVRICQVKIAVRNVKSTHDKMTIFNVTLSRDKMTVFNLTIINDKMTMFSLISPKIACMKAKEKQKKN